jgi:predicted secreted protein
MDNWITIIAVFVVVWWLILFMVLPFGVRPPTEEEMEPGQEAGAPVKPMVWRKMGITTVITVVLCVIFYYLSDSGLISFRPD